MSEEKKPGHEYSETLMEAIRRRTSCLVHYNDEVRVIEPHVIGVTTAGNLAARVWQVGGGSLSQAPVPHWRMMRLDRMSKLTLMDSPSLAPRPDYNPSDRHMTEILAQI